MEKLKWTTVKRKVADLVPYEKNPRILTDENAERLKRSLEKLDLVEIPVINTDNVLIAGHQRVKVMFMLGRGQEKIDVRMPNRELTEQELKEYNVTSNVSIGIWDIDVLEADFGEIDLPELGVDLESISAELPTTATPGEEKEAEEDGFEIPEEVKTTIKQGDLIEIGPHRLVCGDSTKAETLEKLFNGALADLVVTDPPYNVDYVGKTKSKLKIQNDSMSNSAFYDFLYAAFTALAMFTKAGGAWYIWHADSEGANFRFAMDRAGVKVRQCLVWVKNTLVMGRQDYHWKHEPCLYGWKDGVTHDWYSDRKQTTVLEFDRPTRNDKHPTMKPVPLIGYQIKNSSKAGDIVADTFGGSGSTMVACEQLGRQAYLAENDPKYCQVIVDRMKELAPELKITINGKTLPAEKVESPAAA